MTIERWAADTITRELAAALPTTRIQVVGLRQPLAVPDAEEWLHVVLLGISRQRTRASSWEGTLSWQISCFSRYENQRADHDTLRVWGLVGEVRTAIEFKEFSVLDDDDVHVACLKIFEGNAVYVEEALTRLKDTGLHYVALTFAARLEGS